MAAARTFRTQLHEVWAEAVAQIGGVTQNVQTTIPYTPADVESNVDLTLALTAVVGVPTFTLTCSSVGGFLCVAVANTAAAVPFNSATWTLDVRHIHTIVR